MIDYESSMFVQVYNTACQAFETQDMAVVEKCLEFLKKRDPLNPTVLGLEASMYYQLEKYDECIKTAQKGLDVDADNFSCNANMGKALISKNMHAEATPYLEKAIKRRPDDPVLYDWLVYCYARKGQLSLVNLNPDIRPS